MAQPNGRGAKITEHRQLLPLPRALIGDHVGIVLLDTSDIALRNDGHLMAQLDQAPIKRQNGILVPLRRLHMDRRMIFRQRNPGLFRGKTCVRPDGPLHRRTSVVAGARG